jgi:hypothetical protein
LGLERGYFSELAMGVPPPGFAEGQNELETEAAEVLSLRMGNAVSLEQKQAWMLERHSVTSISDEVAERHFSPADVAKLWQVSVDLVRRLFAREPGVLIFGETGSDRKRRYTTMRIPESVLKRVHNRVANR